MLLRAVLAIVALCALILPSVGAHARPSPYPVTPFEGDRYGARQAQMGADVAKAVKARTGAKSRAARPARQKWHRRAPNPTGARQRMRQVPIFAPIAAEPAVENALSYKSRDPTQNLNTPASFGERVRQVVRRVIGRPAAWCGWWLGQHLGMPSRHLWLARNWASVGSSTSGPHVGAIVVWRHHVGIITGHNAMGWIVKSGNDGHRVRERVRSLAGAIAFRSSS